MAYVITDSCVKDNLCFDTCPNNAIAPEQSAPAYATVTQLYINPDDCLDCGACAAACPTNSIFGPGELPADKAAEAEAKNAEYFKK